MPLQRPEITDRPLSNDELIMIAGQLDRLPNYSWGYFPVLAARLLATIEQIKKEDSRGTKEIDLKARR